MIAAGRLDDAEARIAIRQREQVPAPALVGEGLAEQAHGRGHHVHLRGRYMVDAAVAFPDTRCDEQQGNVEAQEIDLRGLLAHAEGVVAHQHEQGVLVPGLFACLLEEVPQRPVGVALRGEVLVQVAETGHGFHRQRIGQGIGSVVRKGLQHGEERPVMIQSADLLQCLVEHVLVRGTPGGIHEHRVLDLIAPDEVAHALVAEETFLVVPGEIAVVDIDVLVAA